MKYSFTISRLSWTDLDLNRKSVLSSITDDMSVPGERGFKLLTTVLFKYC